MGKCPTEHTMLPMPTFTGQFADHGVHATDAPSGGSLGSYPEAAVPPRGLRRAWE